MSDQPILVETVRDGFADPDGKVTFEQRWMCEPPAEGVNFIVLDDEWNEDWTVRTIRQIEVRP